MVSKQVADDLESLEFAANSIALARNSILKKNAMIRDLQKRKEELEEEVQSWKQKFYEKEEQLQTQSQQLIGLNYSESSADVKHLSTTYNENPIPFDIQVKEEISEDDILPYEAEGQDVRMGENCVDEEESTNPCSGSCVIIPRFGSENTLPSESSSVEQSRTVIQRATASRDRKEQLGRFGAESLEDIATRKSKSLEKMMRYAANAFNDFLMSKRKTLDDMHDYQDLDNELSLFYINVRNAQGEFYKSNSMMSLRYGIRKHFEDKGVDILNPIMFPRAQKGFRLALKRVKSFGRGNTDHKRPITEEDYRKMYSAKALDPATSEGLLNKVFVDVCTHFCLRRESLRNLRPEDFLVHEDGAGIEYVTLINQDTIQGDRKDDDDGDGDVMYARNDEKCPVASLKRYIKLRNPSNDAFFQQPKTYYDNTDETETWYCNMAIGQRTLDSKMLHISKKAGLSRRYTNHCLRATDIKAIVL